jgi:UDP-N-acetyl-D-mannosaminuronic acid dehydrogenase
MNNSKNVCVIGLGYIGLPTAALLANSGHNVVGVDINKNVVDTINRGEIHIVENGLAAFVRSAVQSGNLFASLDPSSADIFIIAVPTPFHPSSNGSIPLPNIDFILNAIRKIAPYITSGNLVILESTSPVGTTLKMQEVLKEERPDLIENTVYFSHCPERVLPGRIMIELVENDRIIGGLTPEASMKTADFYKTFAEGQLLVTDAKTAEMAKLTENASRDVGIAFANELSMICEDEGIDVRELISLANHHPRVNILQPGTGVGGHCIAVDPWFIASRNPQRSHLIQTARRVNLSKTEWVIDHILFKVSNISQILKKVPVVAICGLAYKPDIDDLRESPAKHVAQKLQHSSVADWIFVEPNLNENPDGFILSPISEIMKADLVVYLVAHREFINLLITSDELDFCGVLNFRNG